MPPSTDTSPSAQLPPPSSVMSSRAFLLAALVTATSRSGCRAFDFTSSPSLCFSSSRASITSAVGKPCRQTGRESHHLSFTSTSSFSTSSFSVQTRPTLCSKVARHYAINDLEDDEQLFPPISPPISPPIGPFRSQGQFHSDVNFRETRDRYSSSRRPPRSKQSRQRQLRSIPRRAIPHVQNSSQAEAAKRAGYIIREEQMKQTHEQRQQKQRVRPLPSFRRAARLRGNDNSNDRHFNVEGEENFVGLEEEGLTDERKLARHRRIHIQDNFAAAARLQRKQERRHQVDYENLPSDTDNEVKSRVYNWNEPKTNADSTVPQRRQKIMQPKTLPTTTSLSSSIPSPPEKNQNGSRRVTFKATRDASHVISSSSSTLSLSPSSPTATLTEYMSQPVEQYSLLSFHDEEDINVQPAASLNDAIPDNPKQRRWHIRRLTKEEAQMYLTNSPTNSNSDSSLSPSSLLQKRFGKPSSELHSSTSQAKIDESNLFRLAVPLKPLIGWDLTPIIDLEVIPPKLVHNIETDEIIPGKTDGAATIAPSEGIRVPEPPSKWEPLRGIRRRVSNDSGEAENIPVVRIQSLSVSLLSTAEEVNTAMKQSEAKQKKSREITDMISTTGKESGNRYPSSSKMQEEAIGMVGKVEEWLRPKITFEAELSWTDSAISSCNAGGPAGTSSGGGKENSHSSLSPANPSSSVSTVTVRSTAVTSLTIPKLPAGINAAVPSAFLVKRLGATLTNKALEICLPRFLRQLERDYERWSMAGAADAENNPRRQ